MRNRIKGHWSWEDVGILPAELARARSERGEAASSLGEEATTWHRAMPVVAVAGGLAAGAALVWVIRAILRRV
jgi:hypothetical protein